MSASSLYRFITSNAPYGYEWIYNTINLCIVQEQPLPSSVTIDNNHIDITWDSGHGSVIYCDIDILRKNIKIDYITNHISYPISFQYTGEGFTNAGNSIYATIDHDPNFKLNKVQH